MNGRTLEEADAVMMAVGDGAGGTALDGPRVLLHRLHIFSGPPEDS